LGLKDNIGTVAIVVPSLRKPSVAEYAHFSCYTGFYDTVPAVPEIQHDLFASYLTKIGWSEYKIGMQLCVVLPKTWSCPIS